MPTWSDSDTNRQLDRSRVQKWITRVGGKRNATALLIKDVGFSASTSEKIAALRYNNIPHPAVQEALAKLMELERDELFPRKAGETVLRKKPKN